jgi:DNA polymerase-3 subunit delta
MPVQSLDTLFRTLAKGELAPVYYLHGPEEILKDEAVRAILDRALDPAVRDFNLDQRSAAQLDPDDVFALCTTLPMMAQRRVVVLRDLEAARRKPRLRTALLKYLERPAPETVLVLVQGSGEDTEDKEIARLACAVAADPLPADRVRKWLQRRAMALGVAAGGRGREAPARGGRGELARCRPSWKLAALPAGARHGGQWAKWWAWYGETVLDWRDAVMEDRIGPAVALLGPLLDQPGSSGVKLVTLLGTTLVGVGIARSHYDRKLRGRALEDAVFEVIRRSRVFGLLSWGEEKGRWARWAPHWPEARLREAGRAALAADRALKGTTISDEGDILTDLVLRLANQKREAA